MARQIDACRACGNHDLVPVLELGEQAYTGVFPRTRDQSVPSSPLTLVKCHGKQACGLLQLLHSCDPVAMYGDSYGYRSGLNASMVRHLRGKVQRILSTVDVPERGIVLDIGSNDGTTLAAYPSGKFRTIGIDPTAPKFRQFYPPDVQIVPDFFSAKNYRAVFGDEQASVITSFSMFYDLEAPLEFMQDIHQVLSNQGVWIFEQSYLPLMLERNSYDTVCHEHAEYYSLTQIHWMAQRTGFKIIDIEFNDINGGSSSVMAAKADSSYPESPLLAGVLERERALGLDGLEVYAALRPPGGQQPRSTALVHRTGARLGQDRGGAGGLDQGQRAASVLRADPPRPGRDRRGEPGEVRFVHPRQPDPDHARGRPDRAGTGLPAGAALALSRDLPQEVAAG